MKIHTKNSEMHDFDTYAIGFYRNKNNENVPCFYPKEEAKFDSTGRYIGEYVVTPIPIEQYKHWLCKYNEFESELYQSISHNAPTEALIVESVWLEANSALKAFTSSSSYIDATLHTLGIGPTNAHRPEKRSVYGYAILASFSISGTGLKDSYSCRNLAKQLGYSVENGEDYMRQLRTCIAQFKQYLKNKVSNSQVPQENITIVYEWLIFELFNQKKQFLAESDLPGSLISVLENAHTGLNKHIIQSWLSSKDQNQI
ncbi:hypothetical protein VA249_19160 [Vibrio alfacsensis]|uniref:hypothetical protein n=1 Tax=Vibrio alfacsensis TaxID=1074311 RepID=UPI001BEDC774|nr:hypothetical protein [Vibrio alfacsensis]BBM65270.1 hypothetical protein VA249_19160 [Vibrio alfacsensis]